MNDFLSALPWRLASLAALVVAGISIANGVDTWVVIGRCGIAFVAFWAMGGIAKAVLAAADPNRADRPDRTIPHGDTQGDPGSRA